MKKLLPLLVLCACGQNLPPPTPLPQAAPSIPPAVPVPPGYSLSLCWDPSPSPEVTSYELYQDAVDVLSVASPTTRATLTGLNPGQVYRFWVTAKSADQESDPSNELDYVLPVLSIAQDGVRFQVPPTANQGNVVYHLEITTSLTDQNWVEVPYTVTGTTAFAPLGGGTMGFYRARLEIRDLGCGGEKK